MSFPRYPKYKESGVDWVGHVPTHWKTLRLKHAVGLLTEKTDRRTHPVALENVESWSGRYIETGTEFEGDGVSFRSGDILFGKLRPYLAKAYLAPTDGEAVGDFHVLRPSSDVVARFAQYQLLTHEFIAIVDSSTFGAKMPRASWDFMGSMPFVVPPTDEQQGITAFLDRETAKIDALIAEQERLIALLKEKRQAVISHAVTKGLNPDAPMKDSGIEWLGEVPAHWLIGKCGFYMSVLTGFPFQSSGFIEDESATKLLRGVNVGVGCLKWEETVYWQRTPDDDLTIYEMKAGDLVIGMDRPLIAEGMRVAKVTASDLPCLLLQRVASLKTGPHLNADFLMYLLSSEMFVAHFSPETTGVSVPHISPDQIGNFIVPIPPVEEQKLIAEEVIKKITDFDRLISEAQEATALLQERRTALISAAVTGEIDVRNRVAAEAI